jgi:hypothetical protein
MKVKLFGHGEDPVDIETLEIHREIEGFIWLRMFDNKGKKHETACLKETV